MTLPTPHYDLNLPDDVYPPSEDTFLFLDALEKDQEFITIVVKPSLAVEIGCGSGVVSSFFLNLPDLKPKPQILCIDINLNALEVTRATLKYNKVTGQLIRSNLLNGLEMDGKVDILLFNPPYVPTEEKAYDNLSRTYAGGAHGREELDRLLPRIPKLLSKPNGTFYLIALKQNDIKMLCDALKQDGIVGTVLMERRCGIEHFQCHCQVLHLHNTMDIYQCFRGVL
ncbi:unnamed protein product [Bursaphelenchus okinawaensis]|uniref:Methyltransferase HEMK2 n=1 Tax=Bursaphelenchus okinawaensis TaxID=465554 RepID=A0A811K3C9_9BILA|nr:unnamed protein product [Bursaphelenchus okinawaensis]CAG9090852.1 unnamed protein product [Bursaphelenchus okinawaensis]